MPKLKYNKLENIAGEKKKKIGRLVKVGICKKIKKITSKEISVIDSNAIKV